MGSNLQRVGNLTIGSIFISIFLLSHFRFTFEVLGGGLSLNDYGSQWLPFFILGVVGAIILFRSRK